MTEESHHQVTHSKRKELDLAWERLNPEFAEKKRLEEEEKQRLESLSLAGERFQENNRAKEQSLYGYASRAIDQSRYEERSRTYYDEEEIEEEIEEDPGADVGLG